MRIQRWYHLGFVEKNKDLRGTHTRTHAHTRTHTCTHTHTHTLVQTRRMYVSEYIGRRQPQQPSYKAANPQNFPSGMKRAWRGWPRWLSRALFRTAEMHTVVMYERIHTGYITGAVYVHTPYVRRFRVPMPYIRTYVCTYSRSSNVAATVLRRQGRRRTKKKTRVIWRYFFFVHGQPACNWPTAKVR
jgi:hypothetical protein